MAVGQQADEQAIDQLALADEDFFDFLEEREEAVAAFAARRLMASTVSLMDGSGDD